MKFGLRYASLGRYSNGPAAVEVAQAAEAAGTAMLGAPSPRPRPRGSRTRKATSWPSASAYRSRPEGAVISR